MRFLDGGCLYEVSPVGSNHWTHQEPHFRSAAATLEIVEIDLAWPGTGGIRCKTPSKHLEPLRMDPAFTDEIYHPSKTRLINITRPHCAICESCRRVFSTDLSEASPVPPHRFPPWWQQTGSSCWSWFPVWPRRFLDGGDSLRSARSVPIHGHIKDRIPVCCRHAGKHWDWPSQVRFVEKPHPDIWNTWNGPRFHGWGDLPPSKRRRRGWSLGAQAMFVSLSFSLASCFTISDIPWMLVYVRVVSKTVPLTISCSYSLE